MTESACSLKPYGYVYEIVNTVNGKTYVGCRKLSCDKRWRQYMGSGRSIRAAIKKYGQDKFVKRFLGYASTREELFELEFVTISSLKEEDGLRASYNIFNGKGAGGDTFALLDSLTMEDVRKKQSAGIRRHLEATKSERLERIEARHALKRSQYRDAVLDSYAKSMNMKYVSQATGASVKVVQEILESENLILKGTVPYAVVQKRRRSIMKAIGSSRIDITEVFCGWCGKSMPLTSRTVYCSKECVKNGAMDTRKNSEHQIAPHNKISVTYEELYQSYITENLSLFEMQEKFGCKQRTIYNMLSRYDLPTFSKRRALRQSLELE